MSAGTPAPLAAGQDPAAIAGQGDVIFDGSGGRGERAYHWRHLKGGTQSERALLADADIPQSFAWAMLERDTQPRVVREGPATLLILRGINKAANAEPEDMISLRLVVSGTRIVSLEIRRLHFIDRLIAEFRAGAAPASVSAFVLKLVEVLREDAEMVLDALEDDIARLEQKSLRLAGQLDGRDRAELVDARQDAIMLHRFIAPQATALEALGRVPPAWLEDAAALREEGEAFRRISADLDALRGRAQVIAEEINIAMTERTNRIMLTLSTVSVVFLPLTFMTGLLGVNLAGIPFAEHPLAFWCFAGVLVVVTALAVWLARHLLR
ncbi:zinc transporter ZntB [Limibaculum sp. FT325]|uniref:CorA family divalent cation transporter n=1 Tax=Thermohalobaculum sediminis TaxID=2939436 RepID=UPI0020BD7057|nr:CorA family divalent cation transporter [Limibaculum sediminis]MCL5775783.1 zinc transporter ZntB [Limibaculum sediminis]